MNAPESWTKPLDLGDHLSGKILRPKPSLLARSDGESLLYVGKVNEIHGEPEAGKGFIVGQAVGETVFAGGVVLYLDFDADPDSVVFRVLTAGPTAEQIQRLVRYFPINEPLRMVKADGVRAWPDESADALDALAVPEPSLVVIDGVNVAMSLFGLEPRDTPDVADFLRLLVFPFRRTDSAVLLVDHVTKDTESRGRWAYGAIQKSAALDGASYEVRVKSFPAPGRVGRLSLVVSKDRHGGVRGVSRHNVDGKGDVAATVTIDGTGERPRVRIDPATDADDFKPTVYMEKVSRYLEPLDKPVSQRGILDALGGKRDYVLSAIRHLISDGYVKTTEGPNNALNHASIHPYRKPDDD